MFTKDKWENIIKGAYKKLKSSIYYNSKVLFYKEKIADFEASDFNNKIENLISFAINNFQSSDYLNNLLNQISYIPVLKKINEKNNNIVLNYFIDAPMELRILDVLWTILIDSNLTDEKVFKNKFNYGNRIDKNKLYKNNNREIDWDNGFLFERYVVGYNEWINKTIKSINNEIILNDKLYLITSDLSRYYYKTSNVFEILDNYIDFRKLDELKNLTLIIEKIYGIYQKTIENISQMDIGNCILPIGLDSSVFFSNLYLYEFDQEIANTEGVLFYSRYVDDMMIIVNQDIYNQFSTLDIKEKAIKEECLKFLQEIIYRKTGNEKIKFGDHKTKIYDCNYNNVQNQIEKIILHLKTAGNKYYFNDNDEEYSFKEYFDFEKKQLKDNLFQNGQNSEKQLEKLPINQLVLFMNYIYTFQKFDVFTLGPLFQKMLHEIKDTTSFNMWKEYYKWINIFFKEFNGVVKTNEIDKVIDDKIANLKHKEIEEVYNLKQNEIKQKLFDNYKNMQILSKTLAGISDINLKSLELKLSNSGMIKKDGLIKYFISNLENLNALKNTSNFYFQYYKNHVPFIHLWEISMYDRLINSLFGKNKKEQENIKIFKKLNNLKDFENISINKFATYKTYETYKIELPNKNLIEKKKDFIVGQPHIILDGKDGSEIILSTMIKQPTFEETRKFIINLLEAKENKASLLVFPELCIYPQWLHLLGYFSHQNKINIVAGLKNLIINNEFKNLLISLHTFYDNKYHKNTISFVREKNFYSYDEKKWCSDNNIILNDVKSPKYYLIENNDILYADYMCFEITDIFSRGIFKNYVDVISIPMLNKDTDYFNNIIYSLSRDLSTCVITSNSASWGNSSIILPKPSNEKILSEFKGGYNQYCVFSKVPINQLKEFNLNFNYRIPHNIFKKHSANTIFKKS